MGQAMNATETYRHAMEARRVSEYGGGACTLLVRRIDGRIKLLFHAALNTGAVLTQEHAVELALALTKAAQR